MDAVTRISYYFPTHALTIFWVVANIIVNNQSSCSHGASAALTALLVIFCFAVFFASFTDTYVATDGKKFWVFIVPFYGPLCFALPTDTDKDLVWESFFLRKRDYAHAVLSMTTFVLICVFSNPVAMCLYPSPADPADGSHNGTAKFDSVVVRTVPIVVAIIMALVMICLGPPRQMILFGNIPETVKAPKDIGSDNPIFNTPFPQLPPDGGNDQNNNASRDDSGLEMGAVNDTGRIDDGGYNGDAMYSKAGSKSARASAQFYPGGGKASSGRHHFDQGDHAPVRDSYRTDSSAAGGGGGGGGGGRRPSPRNGGDYDQGGGGYRNDRHGGNDIPPPPAGGGGGGQRSFREREAEV